MTRGEPGVPAGSGDDLCHYTRADTAFEHILVPNGTLKMNPYNAMRDPLENQDPFVYERFLDAGEEDWEVRTRALNDALARLRDNVRLLSLTQRAPYSSDDWRSDLYSQPWARPRMWEQYADNHAGVCLVFSKERLLRSLAKVEDARFEHGAVQYTTAGYAGSQAVRDFALEGFTPETADGLLAKYVAKHRDDFFLLKSSDWATEHEYRVLLFSHTPITEPFYLPYGDALQRVVLGANFPAWQRGGVKAAASRFPEYVDWANMTWHRGHARFV